MQSEATTATVAHPFERAGLGKAPFRYVGTEVKVYRACPDAPEQPGGRCDYCGNGIKYNCVIVGADGSRFMVGTDCVRKTDMGMYAEWKAARRAERDALREQLWQEERERRLVSKRVRVDAWIDGVAGLRGAFNAILEAKVPVESKDLTILKDLHASAHRFGSLSEKQVALAIRLAERVRNPQPEDVHVAAPTGRVTFRATVVSLREVEDPFSYSRYSGHTATITKMIVKVQAEGGVWLSWMTVPRNDVAAVVVGSELTITATLQPGRDAHFTFGKRPTIWTEQGIREAEEKAARKAAREAKKAAKAAASA